MAGFFVCIVDIENRRDYDWRCLMVACAAANLATGTRKGEQDT
jgi:hypothetical protein